MADTQAVLDILLRLDDRATKNLKRSLGQVEKQSNQATSRLAKFGQTLQKNWLAIGLAIGGVMVAMRGLKAFVGIAIEFESAFAGVRKTVTATEGEFKKLEQGLIAMSRRIPESAADLAKIQEIAGQLGVRGVGNLEKFTETVAKIATTTNLTKEVAATAFARIANVMQEPLDNIDRMGSAVVALGNTMATTEAEIVTFAQRIAGAGKVAGLTTADLFGFGAAFSSVGVKAERGGTAVNKALIMVGTAVANQTERLSEFADVAGMTSEEFTKAWEKDAAGAFALFVEGLGKEGLKGAAILKELELSDQRLIQAFLSVGGAGGILTKAIKDANEEAAKNNALNEEAAKRFATTEAQMKLLGNRFQEIALDIGEGLLPALNAVIGVIVAGINKVEEFADAIGSLAGGGATGATQEAAEGVQGRLNAFDVLKDQGLSGEEIRGRMGGLGGEAQDPGDAAELAAEQALAVAEAKWVARSEAAIIGSEELNTILDELSTTEAERAMRKQQTEIQASIASIQLLQNETKMKGKAYEDLEKRKQVLMKASQKIEFQSFATTVQMYGQMASQGLNSLANFLTQAQGETKKYAGLIKAIRIGEAIMNTATAVTAAMAAPPFWPLNAAQVYMAGALGAIQIGTIAAQGFAKGTDSVPASLTPGEMVVPRSFASAIRSGDLSLSGGEGGGGGSVNVMIDTANFRDENEADDVFEEISEMLSEQRRAKI